MAKHYIGSVGLLGRPTRSLSASFLNKNSRYVGRLGSGPRLVADRAKVVPADRADRTDVVFIGYRGRITAQPKINCLCSLLPPCFLLSILFPRSLPIPPFSSPSFLFSPLPSFISPPLKSSQGSEEEHSPSGSPGRRFGRKCNLANF